MLLVKVALLLLILGFTAWPASYFFLLRRDDVKQHHARFGEAAWYASKIKSLWTVRSQFSRITQRLLLLERMLSYSYIGALVLLLIVMAVDR